MTIMQCIRYFTVTLCCLGFPIVVLASDHPVRIHPFSSHTFDIQKSQFFEFSIELEKDLDMQVDIVSVDGDLAKTVYPLQKTSSGKLKLRWDGTDKNNRTVPNEAWFPVISYQQDNKLVSVSPKSYSGGEVIDKVDIKLVSPTRIKLSLEKPSRILIRSGVKSGAMLKTIESWQPKDSGSHIIQWNGLDTSGVYPFTQLDDFAVMATGYYLPDHSIITWNHDSKNYAKWRDSLGYKISKADARDTIHNTRNEHLLSKVFFKPKYLPLDPRVTMELEYNDDRSLAIVSVDIPQEDRALVENSLYEVGFFIDGVFISEEEQGYVPFTWHFKPSNYTKGEHYLSVNITGFDGQVGVSSLKFTVP